MHSHKYFWRALLVCGLTYLLAAAPSLRAAESVLDSPMFSVPDLPLPKLVPVYRTFKDLWLKALARPEAELKCHAAEAIAQARRHGVEGLEPTIAPLRAELDRPVQRPAVRLAVAEALIVLEVREAAPSLFEQAQAGDNDLRDLVEPALAKWDYAPLRAVWLARLRDATTPARSLILAIHGLGAVRDEQAVAPLRELVLSERVPLAVRLEAAEVLGALRTEGLEPDAKRLATDFSPRRLASPLCAIRLLKQHRSEDAIGVLQALVQVPEPTVVARAAARLIEIDPKAALAPLEARLSSPDATLRALAAEVLRWGPNEQHIHQLCERLDDPHPDVRQKARESLREIASQKDLRERVIAEATRVLGGDQWRSLEQATILLTQLDHKPAVGRFQELLSFPRPEVYVMAAWGLRKLDVPETLPAVLTYVDAQQKQLRADAENPHAGLITRDSQLSQLNQFLGQRRYVPADAALRAFIPRMERPMKMSVGTQARAAAIWALGLIHEGKVDTDLMTAVEARLNDVNSLPREALHVSRLSAIALGRMKAEAALPSLRRYCQDHKPSRDPIHNACGWAIMQITGEVMEPPGSIQEEQDELYVLIPRE